MLPKRRPDQQRDDRGEDRDDRRVYAHFAESWNAFRLQADQGVAAPPRQKQAEHAAAEREEDAFGQQLAESVDHGRRRAPSGPRARFHAQRRAPASGSRHWCRR